MIAIEPASNSSPFAVPGRWLKGNLHTHTTVSDGLRSPAAAAEWYQEHGYDFLALTDHDYDFKAKSDIDVLTDVAALSSDHFLVLQGIETHPGANELDMPFELLGIGISRSHAYTRRTRPVQDAIDRLRGDGAIVLLAHPTWSGMTFRDILGLEGIVGLEIANTTCMSAGKGFATIQWDDVLARGRRLWGFAGDDAHWWSEVQDHGHSWIMVRAPTLSREAILGAIAAGHFYASQGPQIDSVQVTESEIHVGCSPVTMIACVSVNGGGRSKLAADAGDELVQATLPCDRMRGYVRVECIDSFGRKAWTQPCPLPSL
jgi:hypothetical protein